MKRSAPSKFVQLNSRPSKRVYDPEAVRVIHGQIEELVYPVVEENYDGFFVGTVGGCKVVGNIPFLDWRFVFHLRCVQQTGKFGDAQWKIVDFEQPAFEPLPLSFTLLKVLLLEQTGWPEEQAAEAIASLRSRVLDALPDPANINPDQLMRLAYPAPGWLDELANRCMLFKYNSMKNLTFYWAPETLGQLKMQELAELSSEVERDIARFCFRHTGMFGLPEVSYRNAVLYYRIHNRPSPVWLEKQVIFYDALKAYTESSKQLAIAPGVVVGQWGCGQGMATALKQGVARIVSLTDIDGKSYGRLLMDDHARDLLYVADRLNTLMGRPVDALKPLASARVSLDGLTDEQKAAVEAVFHTNLLIVTGVGGTGKTTTVAKRIADYYGRKRVMPLAYYGSAASILRGVFGRGMTVHKMRVEIHKKRLAYEKIELVILDEGSTVTVELLKMVLSLPNLKKLVLLGDPRQMSPPSAGPVFADLLLRYKRTPVVRKLHQIMRVSGESERAVEHRSVLNRLYKQDFEVPFSRSLDSDSAFVVLPRVVDSDPLKAIELSFRPLTSRRLGFQTLTQKNEVVDQVNQVLFQHAYPDGHKYSVNDLLVGEKVMLLENNYDTYKEPRDKNGLLPAGYRREADANWVFRTDEVNNGEVGRIERIEDCHSSSLSRLEVWSTGCKSAGRAYQRLVTLDTGKQINLRTYSPRNLKRAECCTIAKSQGLQYPVVVVYIHPGFSSTFSQRQLTTAIGRGSQRFVIICAPFTGSLADSEIGKILKTPEAKVEPILATLLKPYREPVYAGAAEPLTEEQERELNDIDDLLV